MTDPVSESFRRLQIEAALRDESSTEREVQKLAERLEEGERRWDEAELREAVARIIAPALRDAGRASREELARSIAPHVVTTIRREILNSQDELVEALHPRIGALIREAVNSAIEDLRRQVDEAIPIDVWIAQMKARLTGAPALGMLVESGQRFEILEAYLIERGSGRLLARELAEAGDDEGNAPLDDDLVAGMIAAIDAFASDTFGGDGFGALRRIETLGGTVYLRASPSKILALRCAGNAPPDIERRIDALLERTIEMSATESDALAPARLAALTDVNALPEPGGVSGSRLIGGIVAAVAACLALVWLHGAMERSNVERWRSAALDAARSVPEMRGYPLTARHDARVDAIVLEGLVPNAGARDAIAAGAARVTGPLPLRLVLPVAGEALDR